MKLCFATNNQNKLREIQALLGDRFELVTLADIGCTEDIPEPYDTIQENAKAKSSYVSEKYGIDCFADDSGLVVPSLNGEPGVHSAYYAGPQRSHDDNIALLLKNLSGVEDRNAYFLTVISLSLGNTYYAFEGRAHGKIIDEKRGSGGFGYDPAFVPDGQDRTFAEMTLAEKSQISHRSIAFAALIDFLDHH
ncbi:MAG: non-canonical purine NTP pyrophosphatase, RdgB/HAM1 family [Dyadobacter sp. 50-39]|uniref:RdgB/HAM1 family non-canonical purine NTP pyrophosphatase n=1 Tax=Dyadobacter sp. 50-39 TaxID=1895756 RepID=UPI0009650235|nr:RdgB/HAM1 family non-canonical purine NTP pyrophosphatase [Dyadobacter sp. 50-39]OJV21078.1 MAG: non-canonical purine NTP pyrophosphatase, RdgB/HAM1 family [Dyadobacter sp. 50-39]